MVQKSLLEAIEYFQGVNSAAGKVDVYALGDEATANMAGDMDERFTVLQLALIGHLLETVRTANDNISLGLEINRLMWFHGMGMCPDKEFWREKYKVHGASMRFGFDCATAGINLAIERINMEVEDLNTGATPAKAEWVSAIEETIQKFNTERTRLGQLTAAYAEINGKIERREPHYPESQRPNVAGIDLKQAFLAIHHEMGAKSAEDAAKANLAVAQTLLTRRSFIEQRAIPHHSPEDATQLLKNVSKMRDNITASLERAAVWLDVQAINEGYNFPVNPNPS